MVTNPTPLVENETDQREEEAPVSYYVKDDNFSMAMEEEKKEKYQSSVPVEVNVVVEPVKPVRIVLEPESDSETGLPGTEIVVTAPTPRTQSPSQEPLFTCTSSDSDSAPASPGQDEAQAEGWASFSGEKQNTETEAGADWANFGTETKTAEPAVSEEVPGEAGEGWAADFSSDQSQSKPQTEPEPVKQKPGASLVRKPSNDAVRKIKIVETETSDDYDSESEIINTNLQVMAENDATTTDAGPDSSDTDSDRDDDSNRKTGRDSSETESASEPEDTSREPSPHIPLPPEQLEPKQLKRLETMKESPA